KNAAAGLGTTSFSQTIWSPFNLTEEEAGNVVLPGGGGGGGVIDPTVIEDQDGGRGAIIQAMRVEFNGQFELEAGDSLAVLNANTGQVLATYTGTNGAFAVTPYATRIAANVPLGIKLQLNLSPPALGTNPFGYLVSAIEYVGENGNIIRQELPTQQTAHYENLGALDNAPTAWANTIFRPTPPGGATLTSWSIHFNRATNLYASSPTDTDRIQMTVLTSGGPLAVPTNYVPEGGFYDPPPLGYQIITTAMSNQKFTFGANVVGVIIEPFLDDEGSYSGVDENYGFWVDTVSYTADNANDVDFSARTLASLQSYSTTARYPEFGSTANEIGEWWVSIPGQTEIGIHFDRSQFRIGPGDALDIYDATGNLVLTIDGDAGDGTGGIIVDPDDPGGGGVVGELLAPTNMPGDIEAQFGWVLVPGDTARLVLRGDGGVNNGYNGFVVDHVAYFENMFLANSERPTELADPARFNQRETGPAAGFGEVR
ncbi:MAG TPA: hypothetical protein VEI97_03895, partial [bacterium]|nr:hypothetical protein [bacterium]